MKILIVDRTQLFQKIIASTLENTNIDYMFVETGIETLTALKIETYEMICISMYLDDMDAFELTQKIHLLSDYHYTPIVLLTSDESEATIEEAMQSGIVDVFNRKDINQLVNFIQRFGLQTTPLNGRVLYIEDSLAQQQLIIQLLINLGLKVDSFTTGEAAFAAFKKQDYDIVITDIILESAMSGVTLANKIRRIEGNKGDVPILAITAFDNISRRINLFHLGINDYVIKPIIPEELSARVKNLIENHQYLLAIKQEKQIATQANADKSEFLAFMSHELKTPLNSIVGYLQIIQMDAEEEPLPEETLEYVNEAYQASQHLLELTTEVLNLSKIESGKINIHLQECHSKDIITAAIHATKHSRLENNISLHVSYSDSTPVIIADANLLKQALINLLSNAAKYNQDNGSIFVNTHYARNSNTLSVTIKDTGLCVSPENLKELFNKFNRLTMDKSKIEGSGLGLYMTKKTLNIMGAEISVKSKENIGSQFIITVPTK